MRRQLIICVVVMLVLALHPGADAHHRRNTYCSPSGDVCQSTAKVNGVRKLRISLAAKYFSRYRLCVTAPDNTRTCKRFRIHKKGPAYGSSVQWARRFPRKGPGAYDVVWKTSGGRVGKRLGFHVT